MGVFSKSLAGPGYIILNVIRVLNIISLLAVIAASSVMLVKTFIVSKFFFFDAVSHVVAVGISIFLIISELPLFRSYYARNWPLYSQNSGFVSLGMSMVVLGVSILGNLNKQATSQKSLGLAFWRIVIAAGIITTVMGVVNIFASYIFRDHKTGVTARQVRAFGAVAQQKVFADDTLSRQTSRRSFHLSRKDTLPSYYSRASTPRVETRQASPPRLPVTISSPINENQEQFAKFSTSPEIQAPNLAHHPAMYSNRI